MLFEQQIRVGPRNHVWRPDPQRKDVLRGTRHTPDNVRCVQSSRPLDTSNSTQPRRHAAAMRAIAISTVATD